ncbi:MAG TPA: LacI family DNA-binding transcriptional regulator [Acidobacteriota bacterium]|jgi:LacI family transcriptional regulator
MLTIKQIAVLADVSTATVSHVLNKSANVSPKLQQRVMKVVRELNYHPNHLARSLRTRRSRTIGMLLPSITNPFFPTIVRGVEDVLRRAGYNLIVGNSDYDEQREEEYYHTFCEKRVDGLVLMITPTTTPEYLRRHNGESAPLVYLDRLYHDAPGDAVLADNVQGSYKAVRHLIENDHRAIGIITGPSQMFMSRRRLRGYKRALQEGGIAVDKRLVRVGDWSQDSGYRNCRTLLEHANPPTALFVSNGLMALGCLRAISELGVRCPEDVALVSFDDLEMFELMKPAITAVDNPGYRLGSRAAEMLVQRLSNELAGPPLSEILPVELKVRASSARVVPTSTGPEP